MKIYGWLSFVLLLRLLPVPASTVSRQDESCRIQVGCCVPLKDMEAVRAAGFDYWEPQVSEIVGLEESDFLRLVARLKEIKLPTPAANIFLPGRIRVTGPAVDPAQQLSYVRRAFDRMSRIGVKIIVFGSSGARNVPPGFSKDEAFNQLVEFCRRIAPEAESRDITIVIEPLRPQESNIINTAVEGLELVKAVSHPRIRLLVDYYHMASQKEDYKNIDKAGSDIFHAHIANPTGRIYPKAGDGCDYAAFFAALRRTHYCSRISVEANSSNITSDSVESISLLRQGLK